VADGIATFTFSAEADHGEVLRAIRSTLLHREK
jgi:hypothetical protein